MSSKRLYKIAAFLLLYYCYLGCLRKIFFPASSITVPTMLFLVLCLVIYAGKGKIHFYNLEDKWMCYSWILIMVYITVNNYNLVHNFISGGMIQLFVMIVFMIFSYKMSSWVWMWCKLSKIFILVHAMATIIFYYNKNLYISYTHSFYSGMDVVNLMNFYNSGEMSGLVSHFSSNGMILAIGVIFFFEAILKNKNLHKRSVSKNREQIFNYFGILVTIYALVLSSKRGPLLATLIAIAITYIISSKKNVTKRIIIMLVVVSVIYGLYTLLLPYVPGLSTIVDKTENLQNSSAGIMNGRYSLWSIALKMFASSPIIGHGYGSYSAISMLQSAITTSAHNYYLQIVSELGIIGFVLYIIAFATAIMFTIRALYKIEGMENKNNRVNSAMLIRISLEIQIFVILYSFTSTSLMYYAILIPFFMACAIPRSIFFIINE